MEFLGAEEDGASIAHNPADGPDLEGLVGYIVRNLVDSPDDVRIETVENNGTTQINISCKKEDIGRVVGKKGKTISAIRSLVKGSALRIDKRASVEILDT